jgi:hypothetical protein
MLIAWCICLLLMEVCGAEFAGSGVEARFDFRAFYAAGYLMRTHPSRLYDLTQQEQVQQALISPGYFLPFYHPSYETLLLAPFSLLHYRSAYLAFIAFNMLGLLAVLFIARPLLSPSIPWLRTRPWLIFFLYLPLLLAMLLGQDSILLLLLCCMSWRQLESRRDMSAGCLLALTLFKFQIAIPLAILITVRRGWRFAAGFIMASTAVALLCIALVGSAGTADYIRALSGATSAINKSAVVEQRMGVYPFAMPNLAGLLFASGARFLRSPAAFNALTLTCSIGVFAWCARAIRRARLKTAFSIAILCVLLVSYHLFIYDLTLALLPVALLADRIHRYILLALFALPLVLLPFGTNSFFLLAVPVLAMLVNGIVSSRNEVANEPETAAAPA